MKTLPDAPPILEPAFDDPDADVFSGDMRLSHQLLARLGGRASAAKLTPQQRRDRAKKAAAARWRKLS